MAFENFGKKRERKNQRDFYNRTQENANAQRRDANRPVGKKGKSQASSRLYYLIPTWLVTFGGYLAICLLIQYLSMQIHNIPPDTPDVGFFHMNPMVRWYFLLAIPVLPIAFWIIRKKFYGWWFNENTMHLTEDIEEYDNDAYIRTIDHLTQELDVAPDVGLGFDGHASTLMGHMMVSNKGIKKIDMPQFDPDVDGYVKRDENGNIITKKMPMFNEKLGDRLFDMSGVPQQFRKWHDATDYDFNRKINKKGKRAGAYGRKEYDKLSDYINNEFYVLDTETERPAGVYFYDSRPVNTVLIAITRGGKGCLPA